MYREIYRYMKIQIAIIVTLAFAIIIIGLVAIVPFSPTQNIYAIKQGNCNTKTLNFLWNHTYAAAKYRWSGTQTFSRLRELTPACVVFTGNVTGPPQDTEHDGDLHFNVTPDNTKDNYDLLNQYNVDSMARKY